MWFRTRISVKSALSELVVDHGESAGPHTISRVAGFSVRNDTHSALLYALYMCTALRKRDILMPLVKSCLQKSGY